MIRVLRSQLRVIWIGTDPFKHAKYSSFIIYINYLRDSLKIEASTFCIYVNRATGTKRQPNAENGIDTTFAYIWKKEKINKNLDQERLNENRPRRHSAPLWKK